MSNRPPSPRIPWKISHGDARVRDRVAEFLAARRVSGADIAAVRVAYDALTETTNSNITVYIEPYTRDRLIECHAQRVESWPVVPERAPVARVCQYSIHPDAWRRTDELIRALHISGCDREVESLRVALSRARRDGVAVSLLVSRNARRALQSVLSGRAARRRVAAKQRRAAARRISVAPVESVAPESVVSEPVAPEPVEPVAPEPVALFSVEPESVAPVESGVLVCGAVTRSGSACRLRVKIAGDRCRLHR